MIRQERDLAAAFAEIDTNAETAAALVIDVIAALIEVEGAKAFDNQDLANANISALRVVERLI